MRKQVTPCVILIVAGITVGLLCGCGEDECICPGRSSQVVFTEEQQFGAGITRSVAWGDYDGDGDLDLAVGNTGDSYIYANEGDGVFARSASFGEYTTMVVKWADSDNDGDLDLLVGNGKSATQQNLILVNDGDGGLSAISALGQGGTADLACGDLDSDGYLDVVVANWIVGQTDVYDNQGGNIFTRVARLPMAVSVEVFDVDGDEDLDIALGVGCCLDSSAVYKNDGSGSFLFSSHFGTESTEMQLSYADYDDDGDLDLAAGAGGGAPEVRVYENDGNGDFSEAFLLGNAFLRLVEWGDFDMDGDPDLVTGSSGMHGGDRLVIYVNSGGLFHKETIDRTSETGYPYEGCVSAIALGDADNDGDLDIAAGRFDWLAQSRLEPAPNSLFINSRVTQGE